MVLLGMFLFGCVGGVVLYYWYCVSSFFSVWLGMLFVCSVLIVWFM